MLCRMRLLLLLHQTLAYTYLVALLGFWSTSFPQVLALACFAAPGKKWAVIESMINTAGNDTKDSLYEVTYIYIYKSIRGLF